MLALIAAAWSACRSWANPGPLKTRLANGSHSRRRSFPRRGDMPQWMSRDLAAGRELDTLAVSREGAETRRLGNVKPFASFAPSRATPSVSGASGRRSGMQAVCSSGKQNGGRSCRNQRCNSRIYRPNPPTNHLTANLQLRQSLHSRQEAATPKGIGAHLPRG